MSREPREIFTIELEPMSGWDNSPCRRLAKLLKVALRQHGFRCTDYRMGRMRDSQPIDSAVAGRDDDGNAGAMPENASPSNCGAKTGIVEAACVSLGPSSDPSALIDIRSSEKFHLTPSQSWKLTKKRS